jgi:hypothetical protein
MDTLSTQGPSVEGGEVERPEARHDDAEFRAEVQAEAEKYLTDPKFEGIFDAAVEAGALPADVVDHYKSLEGEERIARYREIFAEINPRNRSKYGFVERSDMKAAIASPVLGDAIKEAAESAGMYSELPIPPGTKAKLGVVHGGAGKTPLLREEFLLDALDRGDASVEYLAMLGIDRPVDEAERGRAGEYAGDAKTEAELMDAAAVHWLRKKGLDDVIDTRDEHEATKQGGHVSGMKYKVVMYDLSGAKGDGRLTDNFPDALFVVNAPIDATRLVREGEDASLYKTRADTQDTLDFVAKTAGVEAGDTVLAISHQPVLDGQHLATQDAFLDYGARVVSAGYHSAALSGNQNVVFGELCKDVENAGRLRDRVVGMQEQQQELPAAA